MLPHRQRRRLRIDRGRTLSFRFDDMLYTGYAGDILASVLTAAGWTRQAVCVSDIYAGLVLAGRAAPAVLATACSLDLDPATGRHRMPDPPVRPAVPAVAHGP